MERVLFGVRHFELLSRSLLVLLFCFLLLWDLLECVPEEHALETLQRLLLNGTSEHEVASILMAEMSQSSADEFPLHRL